MGLLLTQLEIVHSISVICVHVHYVPERIMVASFGTHESFSLRLKGDHIQSKDTLDFMTDLENHKSNTHVQHQYQSC